MVGSALAACATTATAGNARTSVKSENMFGERKDMVGFERERMYEKLLLLK